MKNNILSIVFLAFALFSVTLMVAQPGPGPMTAPPTPIDGGLSILLAAGAALGYKKFKGNKTEVK